MKYLIAALPLFAVTIAFAGGHIESKCYPPDGTIWTFEIWTDERDQWDSSATEHPPLSPKKAKDLATAFLKQVPFGDKMKAWSLSTITLRRMSGDQLPEHWIYEVHFDAQPKADVWNGPVPWFMVMVRMDGTIPKPVIQKKAAQ